MAWMMAGQVALNALGSFLQGGVAKYNARSQQAQAASQAYLNGISEIRGLSKAMDLQAQQNEKVLRADMYNYVNTQYMSGLAGVQDALSRKVTAQNQHLISRGEKIDLGEASANLSAAGSIGASADAVKSSISRNSDSIRVDVDQQRELERDAYYQEVRSLYTNYYQNQLEVDTTLPDVPDDPRIYRAPVQGGGSIGQHLLGSAISTGTEWLGQRMQLGLGPKPSSPVLNSTINSGMYSQMNWNTGYRL